jgi:hypothetical protein
VTGLDDAGVHRAHRDFMHAVTGNAHKPIVIDSNLGRWERIRGVRERTPIRRPGRMA